MTQHTFHLTNSILKTIEELLIVAEGTWDGKSVGSGRREGRKQDSLGQQTAEWEVAGSKPGWTNTQGWVGEMRSAIWTDNSGCLRRLSHVQSHAHNCVK